MSIKSETIAFANLEIDVIRKDIKNMHLAVYPPTGRIRLSAPNKADKDVLRLFAISKLGWIKKHIRNFKEQARETPRDYISGESHYFQGKRYLLKVIEGAGRQKVVLAGPKSLHLHVRPNASKKSKAILMREWYRQELKAQIPDLLAKWEKKIGVEALDCRVKLMKTKWGACNIEARRIWLNLELAKKPIICLEYILVHELVHLLERHHNERFVGFMDQYMPKWRLYREELNRLPVAHGEWGY